MPTASNRSSISKGTAVGVWECAFLLWFYTSFLLHWTGSKGPALATAGSFKVLWVPWNPFIFLHTGRPSRACPRSLPGYLDKYLTDHVFFSLSFLLASPIFSLFNFKELILDWGRIFFFFLKWKFSGLILRPNNSQKFNFTTTLGASAMGQITGKIWRWNRQRSCSVERRETYLKKKKHLCKQEHNYFFKYLGAIMDLLCSCYCVLL